MADKKDEKDLDVDDNDTEDDVDKRMSGIETTLAELTKSLNDKVAAATKKAEPKPDKGAERLDVIEKSIGELKKAMDNFIAAGGVVNEGGDGDDGGSDGDDNHSDFDDTKLEDLDYSI